VISCVLNDCHPYCLSDQNAGSVLVLLELAEVTVELVDVGAFSLFQGQLGPPEILGQLVLQLLNLPAARQPPGLHLAVVQELLRDLHRVGVPHRDGLAEVDLVRPAANPLDLHGHFALL
jgi:hypothetical protein